MREKDLHKNNPLTMAAKIYLAIKEKIVAGQYMPGEHLIEADLISEYDCSRTTIREALRMLLEDGLVVMLPNKGTRVRKMSVKEIVDMYLVLMYLSILSVRLAAQNATDEQIGYLNDILIQVKVSAEKGDLGMNVKSIQALHEAIAEISSNEELKSQISKLCTILNIHYIMVVLEKRMKVSYEQHSKIVNAIENHDADLAERLMKSHIEGTIALMEDDLA